MKLSHREVRELRNAAMTIMHILERRGGGAGFGGPVDYSMNADDDMNTLNYNSYLDEENADEQRRLSGSPGLARPGETFSSDIGYRKKFAFGEPSTNQRLFERQMTK